MRPHLGNTTSAFVDILLEMVIPNRKRDTHLGINFPVTISSGFFKGRTLYSPIFAWISTIDMVNNVSRHQVEVELWIWYSIVVVTVSLR
jgi:hypothetical protein